MLKERCLAKRKRKYGLVYRLYSNRNVFVVANICMFKTEMVFLKQR